SRLSLQRGLPKGAEMKVVPFAEVPPQTWDGIAAGSPQAWMMHRADWVAIETRFFAEQNLSFALAERDQIVGVQPLYLARPNQTGGAERFLHSGIHRHAGLSLAPGLDAGTARAAERAAMAHLFREAERLDVDRIQLGVHNLAPVCFTTDRPEIPFWV